MLYEKFSVISEIAVCLVILLNRSVDIATRNNIHRSFTEQGEKCCVICEEAVCIVSEIAQYKGNY